jgi:uncharacterized membrane protein
MLAPLSSFIPTPLHPAIVHLPMALVVLLPVFAVVALVAVHRGARPLRSWGVAAAMFAALSISAWASMETGEDQEDAVETIVPDAALDTHEDAAEQFLWLSVAVLGVAGVGLLGGRVGSTARVVATAGALGLLVAGYRVGHSGGELVYRHGAATAYVNAAATRVPLVGEGRPETR